MQPIGFGSSRNIAIALEKSRQATGSAIKDWAGLLGVSEAEYELVRTGSSPLSIASLDAAAKFLNVSLESFAKNDLDTAAIAARFQGNTHYLRERYSAGALSRRWSSINILDYVEDNFGFELK